MSQANEGIYSVIGYGSARFQGDDGKWVDGIRVYLGEEDPNWLGQKAVGFFFTQEKWNLITEKPAIGEVITPTFNRHGKIIKF